MPQNILAAAARLNRSDGITLGGLDHTNLEHLIRTLMRSPQVIEQSRRFSAMRYKKDPIHATLFSDAIAY
ncbi:hypothetical protein A3A67_00865 [Candidatus Peribacteria bacterium RIFCSPLOWO2_01_FULL_51_18]|nr:MAG: hypothetical protein A3C52_01515 [Candidatus Peribacteria bacterium RIFCSPHIGHO2_02_FULL_51_15]OGJ65853.1 MAG: hypothetical protein A3A67_00865 [Candidatus Peribacteria bacterium RIFCSPLOWO2_01_FULL_51_18]